mmetsp:Transcript_24334/g.55906  ORF Transcript_24334/g.55906 Transcript_24334/m.55906 type:complete len:302 (-) Transcript_24334:61-966(-)
MATDSGHTLIGGLPEMDGVEHWASAATKTSKIYQLNTGNEMLLDMALLRCPCGTPFQSSRQSAICSMCCNATCSAACHRTFIQDKGHCIYYLHYIPEARPEIHGCRDIRWCVAERSPAGTYLSRVCGPRFLEAITGHEHQTLLLRRGYLQYGQPQAQTLAAMTPLDPALQRPLHAFRRNMCQCAACRARQPHAEMHGVCAEKKERDELGWTASQFSQMTGLPAGHPLARATREQTAPEVSAKQAAQARKDAVLTGKPDPNDPSGGRSNSAPKPPRVKGLPQSRLGIATAGKSSAVAEAEDE